MYIYDYCKKVIGAASKIVCRIRPIQQIVILARAVIDIVDMIRNFDAP